MRPSVGIEEHGVVAEAAAALRCARDLPRPRARRDHRRGVVGRLERDEHAVELRAAVERLRSRAASSFATFAPSSACSPAKRAERTPGAPPSAATTRPESSAIAGSPVDARGVARLLQRVLDERCAGFGRQRRRRAPIAPSRANRCPLRQAAPTSSATLPRFAVASTQCRGSRHFARTAACAASNCSMPTAARSSSASSSPRCSAWPSAVPCTSTKPLASFITTFMSVSASESSA